MRKDAFLDLNLDLNLKLSMKIPYQNLHIYEISGPISDSRDVFKQDFIGCWNEGEISFLFFSQPHDEEVELLIKKKGYPLLAKNTLDYMTWQAGEELRPFQVGNLVICPPWERAKVEEGQVLVRLDPCVVFGTGYHPTTRTCLQAIWDIYQKEKPKKVLDLGTGSGILALGAAKWGAEKVLAIDCNELAVETALRNVLSNGESQRIEVRRGKAEDFANEEANLVCANIHLQVIESLLKKKAFLKKRWIILSGIFEKDAEEIEGRLKEKPLKIVQRLQGKIWSTLVGLNEDCKSD
ncbi:MAG TPA: 50S ribosomal protein L11 methyltransferase [Thermodesulfobacteriota bacterium]|nr:50S ribosomal protein L11 methyltransferase [Thermodesulfobacteriota bacterium]